MRTVALVNQKGGVGKTTTAVNLSAGLARLGKRVLLIDLDPQAHATVAMGLDPRGLEKTVYTLLAGQARVTEVIRPVSEGLSIIPSNIQLAGGEAELASVPNPTFVLKAAMAQVDPSEFDYVLIDSPPQLGFLNVNSLAWVREVMIPVTCEFYAIHGLALLMDTVERIRARLNPLLEVSAVIPCQLHPRRAITRDVLGELERHFPGRVLKTRIRVNVRLVEAPSHGKSIFDYAPDSNGATDYMNLAREILDQPSSPLLPACASTAEESPVAVAPSPSEEPSPAVSSGTEASVSEEVSPPREDATPAAAPVDPPPAPAPAAEPGSEAAALSESIASYSQDEGSVTEPRPPEVTADSPASPSPTESVLVPAETSGGESASGATESELPPSLGPSSQDVESTPAAEESPTTPEPPPGSNPEVKAAEEHREPEQSPFVPLDPGVPLTTPVEAKSEASGSMAGSSSTYAQMLGLAGLKPIIVTKPGNPAPPPQENGKKTLGRRLLGKLMGRGD